MDNADLAKLGRLKSSAEITTEESARLDAEFRLALATPGEPTSRSDLSLMRSDQIKRHNQAESARVSHSEALTDRERQAVEDLQRRALAADARAAEWELQQMNEALGRS